jgi:chromosome segregation ATPase
MADHSGLAAEAAVAALHEEIVRLRAELADYVRAWELCQERIDEQDRLIARLRRAWLRCSESRERALVRIQELQAERNGG